MFMEPRLLIFGNKNDPKKIHFHAGTNTHPKLFPGTGFQTKPDYDDTVRAPRAVDKLCWRYADPLISKSA